MCGAYRSMTLAAFNQSKIKMWRRCQKQYAFRYDYSPDGKELVPKHAKVQLQRGTWLHALIEAHFREEAGMSMAKGTWKEVHAQYKAEFDKLFEEERSELGDLPDECYRIFKSYLRFYGDEGDRYVTAKLHDGSPAVEFVLEAELPDGRTFKGRVDRLVEDTEYGGLWVWDHKWVKTVPDSDERMMSPQSPMYVWGLRSLDYDLRGFLYNYGRTKAPAIPQVLKKPQGAVSQRRNMDTDIATYCKVLKEQYGENWKTMAKTVYREHLQRLKNREVLWFRRERIPVDDALIERCLTEFTASIAQIDNREDHLTAPRSYFYNCKFGCEYHALCVAEFTGLNIDPLIKSRYELIEERYGETEDLLSA